MSRGTSTTIRATTATSTRTTTRKPPSSRTTTAAACVIAAIVYALAAFGGAYAWTLPPLLILAGAAFVLARPRLCASGSRLLDVSLLFGIAVVACQLIPLNPAWRTALSPHADAVDAALRVGDVRRWRPLTLDPEATATWLPAGIAAVALFWAAREVFDGSTARRTVRAIAWSGAAVSALAVVQRYLTPGLVYFVFRPVDPGGATGGPFVNRNHLAAWLLLALPTTVGYLVSRVIAMTAHTRGRTALSRVLEDPRMVWLAGAAAAMLVGLITAQSRSGLLGLLAAFAIVLVVPRAAGRTPRKRWAALLLVAALGVAAAAANTGALLARFENKGSDPIGSRRPIWQQTVAIIRDFPVTGVGVGAYGTAMLTYQRQRRYEFFYNQAHDQYLQFAAEGGLLLSVPIALAAIGFAGAAYRALAADRTPFFWMRAAAASALAAVAVQSVWETGLRMPANAALFAVVAALVVRDRQS